MHKQIQEYLTSLVKLYTGDSVKELFSFVLNFSQKADTCISSYDHLSYNKVKYFLYQICNDSEKLGGQQYIGIL
jgi:hypothetical protein